MHYLITEDELHLLERVMRQLGFIYDLCTQDTKDDFQQLDMRGLLAFCQAQEDAIRQTIQAAEARHEEACRLAQTDGTMNPFDWMMALRIASGDHRHTPRGAEEQITRKLTLACLADPDMKMVQAEWVKLLCDQGDRARQTGGTKGATTFPELGNPFKQTRQTGGTEGATTAPTDGSAPVARTSKAKGKGTTASPSKRQKLADGAAA